MKMDLAKVWGCLAVSVLPLLLLVDPTEACYCLEVAPATIQEAYCTSDVVLVGSFTNARFDGDDLTWAIYEFYINRVIKGDLFGKRTVTLYTKILGTTCGYRHSQPFDDTQYLVTGMLEGYQILITVCSIIKPMDQLTSEEMNGLEGEYSSSCN